MSSTRIPDRLLEPRKLPKQGRSGATVEAILEAATQVFERQGYAAGEITEVVRAYMQTRHAPHRASAVTAQATRR
jgi:hypothetical protein